MLSAIFLSINLSSCKDRDTEQSSDLKVFSSYRDIPGITEDEISAITALREQYPYFTYGMPLSIEMYKNHNGEMSGFSVFITEWLTELFGIPFKPALFDRFDLYERLSEGEVSFTGELTSTPERLKIFSMTDFIALRNLMIFRLYGSRPLEEIAKERPVRTGFIEGAATIKTATREMAEGTFEIVELSEFYDVYDALRSGKIDAFYYSKPAEINFIQHSDIISERFFPLRFMPVSISTQDPNLKVVISVIDKALQNADMRRNINEWHRQAQFEYGKFKFHSQLSEEERQFIADSPTVLICAYSSHYPISFYCRHEDKRRGIFPYIFNAISELSDLRFEYLACEDSESEHCLPQITFATELADGFELLPKMQITDRYALISNVDLPDLRIYDVLYHKVGLARNTQPAETFKKWFPFHNNTVYYDCTANAFDALISNDVDLVMATYENLWYLSNYLELPNFNANIIFDYNLNVMAGIDKDAVVLRSIIKKALNNIEIQNIKDYWMKKNYDYRGKIHEARQPFIVFVAVLLFLILILVVVFLVKSRRMSKELEKLVKKRTAELNLAREAAESANKTKSAFLANMSHEIRTPMNAILGITEILIEKEGIPAELEEEVEHIYNSCNLLLGIINDILDFSKIEAKKMDIIPVEYIVASLINDAVQLNTTRIDHKPIEFELDIRENIPAKLIGDEIRIKQILNNLLSNAFKYTDAGKIKFSIEFAPGKNENEIELIFCVKDTGHGMSQDQLERLFEEYIRFNIDKKTAIQGTGLGLVITRSLVDIMNGKIEVKSEPNVGTTFIVRLPQIKVNDEVLSKDLIENLKKHRNNYLARPIKKKIFRTPMPYGSVLIVDDMETNRYVAVGLMKLYRLKIDTAKCGQTAIDKVKSGKAYDVVFMDHMMPDMDGIEATKRIRDLGYDVPIVALTANAVVGQENMFLENGFDDFISKPIDMRQLNSVLNRLVRDKQPQEVIEAAIKQYGDQNQDAEKDETSQEETLNMQISGLDIPKGLRRYRGDIRAYLMLLRSYAANIDSVLKTVELLSDERIVDYEIAVHGIKGASLDIFAEEVGTLAKKLEEEAKARNMDFLYENNAAFLEAVRKLVAEIKEALAVWDAENPKPKKDKPDGEILKKLVVACKNYNMKEADAAIDEIEKYQYTSDDGLALWLRESVDRVDFEEIIEKLSAEN